MARTARRAACRRRRREGSGRAMWRGRGGGSVGGGEQRDEDDGAHAVVEEGFAGELGFEVGGGVDAAEHFEDGDRVGGGDEGAEEEALERRGVEAEEADGVVGEGADGERGEDCGDDGEQGDRELLSAESFEIEQEGSGEEEQGEHAVEDEALEVDLADDARRPIGGGRARRERAGPELWR